MQTEGLPLKINETYTEYLVDEMANKEDEFLVITEDYSEPSLTVNYGEKLFKITDFSKIEYLGQGEKLDIAKTYENVEEMVNDNEIEVGKIVSTKGYYEAGDAGGAIYKISETNEGTIQEETVSLSNGLKANIQIQNKTLDIKQLGAVGDGQEDESDLIQKASSLMENKINTLTFSKGTYLIKNNQVELYSGNYCGKEGANIKITLINDRYIFVNKSGNTITIDNIDFSFLGQDKSNTETTKIIRLDNTTNSKITNCNFKSEEGNYNGVWGIDLYSQNKNVLIDNCKFNLFTTEENQNNKITAISVREYRIDKTTDEITVSNCNLEKNGVDEILWIDAWQGTLKNVTIDKCTIVDKGHNDTSISVGASQSTSTLDVVTLKNLNVTKYNYAYILYNIGIKSGSDCGKAQNINIESNDVTIESCSTLKAGAAIFSGSTGAKTQNIEYNDITLNTKADVKNIFYNQNETVVCKNIHLNITKADCVFYEIKEVDGVDSEIALNSRLARNVQILKNVKNLEIVKGTYPIQLYDYKKDSVVISNCKITCNNSNFLAGSINNADPNYSVNFIDNSEINITSDDSNYYYYTYFYFQGDQQTSDSGIISVNITDCNFKRSDESKIKVKGTNKPSKVIATLTNTHINDTYFENETE